MRDDIQEENSKKRKEKVTKWINEMKKEKTTLLLSLVGI